MKTPALKVELFEPSFPVRPRDLGRVLRTS